ncbi:MAG: DUF1297 domain-containing protein [Euryarchaeota archaeon]|nr:DUF1297 domain-containing protein [Euryarchaeota archaeon]
MIERREMQEMVAKYKEPIVLSIGSHSALDVLDGARAYGFRRIVYVPLKRANIYLRHPIVGDQNEEIEDLPEIVKRDLIVTNDVAQIKKKGNWKLAILIVDRYDDVLKNEYQDAFTELETIQIPNRAFAVYVGGYACEKIERNFKLPILGSRNLLKIENREEVKENYYYLLEKGGVPHPEEYKYKVIGSGIEFEQEVPGPVVFKVPHAVRRLERGFLFAANGKEMERKVREAIEQGDIDPNDLKDGRAEEYVPGVTANLNFFHSPIDAKADLGELSKYYENNLGTQFISVDMRFEATHDGISRMHAKDQIQCDWSKTRYSETFEVVAHGGESVRESLLRLVFPIVDKFDKICKEEYPPGMIGAYCIQTLITFRQQALMEGATIGVYDVPEGKRVTDFDFVCQDVATRLGGGTNAHMGLGGQYGIVLYNKQGMSMGKRIALELKKAKEKKMLEEIVT